MHAGVQHRGDTRALRHGGAAEALLALELASGVACGSVVLFTATDSPVSDACSGGSSRFRSDRQPSAGRDLGSDLDDVGPTRARRVLIPHRRGGIAPISLCISLSASSALSALLSYTPTIALRTRTKRDDAGFDEVTKDSSTPGTALGEREHNDTSAATEDLHEASSNCSSTSFHRLALLLVQLVEPVLGSSLAIFVSSRPVSGSTPSSAQTSAAVAVHGVYPTSPMAYFFDGVLQGAGWWRRRAAMDRGWMSSSSAPPRHAFPVSPPISAQRRLCNRLPPPLLPTRVIRAALASSSLSPRPRPSRPQKRANNPIAAPDPRRAGHSRRSPRRSREIGRDGRGLMTVVVTSNQNS